MHPVVKVIQDSGCQSYIIGCRETGAALLIDPKVGRRDTYRKCFHDFGLTPAALVDTHTHADHLSDSIAFLNEGLPLYMSRLTRCRRDVVRIGDEDVVRVGGLSFRVFEVPGHTDDSVALVGHGLAIVGDTLLAGSLARADFRGSDPERLWDSVKQRILTLPDETVVLPGHNYRDILFTTVGAEKRNNPALRHPDAASYAAELDAVEGAGNTPDVDRMLRLNQEANPLLPDDPSAVAACCDAGGATAVAKAEERTPSDLAPQRDAITGEHRWVDVRDAWEFAAGHIPGTENVPLGELGFHLDDLSRREPLVLSCLGGVRSMTAARTLHYLGAAEHPVSMSGGFRQWKDEGLPVTAAGSGSRRAPR